MALIDNIVAYYKLDDNTDEVSTTYDMAATGSPAYSGGIVPNALFGGNDNPGNYLTSGGNWGIAGGPFTFSCWISNTNAPSVDHGMMGCVDNATDVTNMLIYDDGGGTPVIYHNRLKNGVADGKIQFTQTLPIDGTFHHIVSTYDGATGVIYYDGVMKNSGALSGAGTGVNVDLGVVGTNAQTPARPFDGYVDEVAVWNRALSTAEVIELFSGGVPKVYPFAVSVTVTPATLALSTTAETPLSLITFTVGSPLAMIATLNGVSVTKIGASSTVQEGPGTKGTRIIETGYPYVEGLVAGTTKQ